MLNRWIGIATAAAMVLANGAIFVRDILPRLLPNDTPPSDAQLLAPNESRYVQVGIYDAAGGRIGQSWTRSTRSNLGELVTVQTTTVLQAIALPASVQTPRVRIETELTYRANQRNVDELHFKMHGLGFPLSLDGESMQTGEFACQWQIATEHGAFLLDAAGTAVFGDVIRPFDNLPELYVGRTWRLKLLDPVAQIAPGLKESGFELEPIVIRVTGTENIQHRSASVEAFVVEGGGAIAWVARDGRVLRQEVTVPLLGKLVLLDEEYDATARDEATRSVRTEYR
jgi:hypothetical protein